MFISIHIFSIHASLVGCNRFLHLQTDFSQFQFMHPIRDATMSPIRLRISRSISIHASRNGCNFKNKKLFHIYRYFNSCTPSGVQRGRTTSRNGNSTISIHALRVECNRLPQNFNSCTPSGVQPRAVNNVIKQEEISIHALRVECNSKV